jgi:hypothetical protein
MPNRVRVVIDREAYLERKAIMEESGVDPIEATQAATVCGYNTGFALACTALANGDDGPARELCRREARVHGREWAERLRDAIKEAVAEAM